MRSFIYSLGVLVLGILVDVDPVIVTGRQLEAKTEEHISAPVSYDDTMLIVSDDSGTAAIVFTNEVKKGVKYKFKYISKDGKIKKVGNGLLIDKVLYIPTNEKDVFEIDQNGSEFFIRAQTIKLEWSYYMQGKGWIYYYPEQYRVEIANSKQFDSLDLKRFNR